MAVTYGWITGTVLQPIADTETAGDRTPADRPSAGEVILTPLVAATAGGKIIARDSIRRPLDAQGRITDLDGDPGAAVPVGSYRVEWALTSGRWPAHDITVTAEHTKAAPYDIGTQAPVTPAPGAPVTLLEVPSGAYADAILGWGDDGLEWQPSPTATIPGAVQDYLTANPPSGSPDATTLAKGIVRLGGDLGGTADAPTVPGLAGKVANTDPRLTDARTPTAHTHDDRYYTETETNTLLPGNQAAGTYAPSTHNHDDRYYTETETNTLLAGKQAAGSYAASTHNHDGTYSPVGHNHTGTYAPALGPDDNYVTDAEKANLHTHPAVIAQGADATAARTAIGAGTSSFSGAYAALTGKPTLGTAAATASTDYATAAQGTKADTALQPATGQAINAQTGTTYTLVAGDAGKLVTLNNAAAITLTVPGNVFTTGQRVDCLVMGAGMVTAVGSSCTVNGTPSLVSRAQYSAFTVLFTSATTAVAVGDLASA